MMSIKIGFPTHLKKNDSFTLSKITNSQFEVIIITLFKKQYFISNNVTATFYKLILDLWEQFLSFIEFLSCFNFLLFFNTVIKILQHVGILTLVDWMTSGKI